jgi:hypothetical protein
MAITLKTVLERLAAAEIRIDELERRNRCLSELETALARAWPSPMRRGLGSSSRPDRRTERRLSCRTMIAAVGT